MAFSLELLQSSEPGDLVRGLSKWRESLMTFLGFPLLSPRGVLKKDVRVTPAGVRVEPGFQPSSWVAFHARATTATALVVESQSDRRGLTLSTSGGDVVVDVWLVP